jgi:hypothetical protein
MRLAANLVHGLLLSFLATTALAQEIGVPPVEIGGQLTALGALGEGLHMRALVGPRITVNLSQRNALEVSADVQREDISSRAGSASVINSGLMGRLSCFPRARTPS